jgi:putative membrane protein
MEATAVMGGIWEMTLGGWLWMVIWVVALTVMVWLLVFGGRGRDRADDPLEILRARYARGDISEEEFRHARDLLSPGGTS